MRCLDHHHAEGDTGDQPVASRKVARTRHMTERHFRNRRSRLQQFCQQAFVLGRIDAVVAASQHGDGAGIDAVAMRCLIDPAR